MSALQFIQKRLRFPETIVCRRIRANAQVDVRKDDLAPCDAYRSGYLACKSETQFSLDESFLRATHAT